MPSRESAPAASQTIGNLRRFAPSPPAPLPRGERGAEAAIATSLLGSVAISGVRWAMVFSSSALVGAFAGEIPIAEADLPDGPPVRRTKSNWPAPVEDG